VEQRYLSGEDVIHLFQQQGILSLLTSNAERKIFRIHHTLHESEPTGKEILWLVLNHNLSGIQIHT
jgi:hypothetical protein